MSRRFFSKSLSVIDLKITYTCIFLFCPKLYAINTFFKTARILAIFSQNEALILTLQWMMGEHAVVLPSSAKFYYFSDSKIAFIQSYVQSFSILEKMTKIKNAKFRAELKIIRHFWCLG